MYLLKSDPNVCVSRRSQRVNIVPDGTLEKVRRLWNDGDSGPDCERRRQHRIPRVVRSSYSRSCRPTFVMSTPSMYMLPDAGSMMRNSERSSWSQIGSIIRHKQRARSYRGLSGTCPAHNPDLFMRILKKDIVSVRGTRAVSVQLTILMLRSFRTRSNSGR